MYDQPPRPYGQPFPPEDSWPPGIPIAQPPAGEIPDPAEKHTNRLVLRFANLAMAVVCGLVLAGMALSKMTMQAIGYDAQPVFYLAGSELLFSLMANLAAAMWPIRSNLSHWVWRGAAVLSTLLGVILLCGAGSGT